MRKMINKKIGVSLITLTLVVSLFSATNVYAADSYKHKGKEEGKGLRVIIDHK